MSWNREQGYIACGGEEGLLKVLRLETQTGMDDHQFNTCSFVEIVSCYSVSTCDKLNIFGTYELE